MMYWELVYRDATYCAPKEWVAHIGKAHYELQCKVRETVSPPPWYALKRLQGAPHDQWVKKDD